MNTTNKNLVVALLVVVIILLLILIVGVGMNMYKNNTQEVPVITNTVNTPAPSPENTSNTPPVTRAQQYTDSQFGFSFWYPSSWTVSQVPVTSPDDNGWFQGGTIVKELRVQGTEKSLGVTIQEFHSFGLSIAELGQSKSASPVGVDQKFYFDTRTHTWMYENLTETPNGAQPAGTLSPADISRNTMGGLHILAGARRFGSENIIPLSANDFLVVSSNDATNPDQKYLVDTILATDPAVATPVSQAEQKQTIQKEIDYYVSSSSSTI